MKFKEYLQEKSELNEATLPDDKLIALSNYLNNKFFDNELDIMQITQWIKDKKIDPAKLLLNIHYRNNDRVKKAILSNKKNTSFMKNDLNTSIDKQTINDKFLKNTSNEIDKDIKTAESNISKIISNVSSFNQIVIESMIKDLIYPRDALISKLYQYRWYRSHAKGSSGIVIDQPAKNNWEKVTGETLIDSGDNWLIAE